MTKKITFLITVFLLSSAHADNLTGQACLDELKSFHLSGVGQMGTGPTSGWPCVIELNETISAASVLTWHDQDSDNAHKPAFKYPSGVFSFGIADKEEALNQLKCRLISKKNYRHIQITHLPEHSSPRVEVVENAKGTVFNWLSRYGSDDQAAWLKSSCTIKK